MKEYLNDFFPWILFLDVTIMIMNLIIMIALSIYNRKNYQEIVNQYTDKFGSIPLVAAMSKEASFIGTPYLYHGKVAFIINSLLYPYCRLLHPQMTREQYNFIRELPSDLTFIFKVEGGVFIIGVTSLILMIFLCQYI